MKLRMTVVFSVLLALMACSQPTLLEDFQNQVSKDTRFNTGPVWPGTPVYLKPYYDVEIYIDNVLYETHRHLCTPDTAVTHTLTTPVGYNFVKGFHVEKDYEGFSSELVIDENNSFTVTLYNTFGQDFELYFETNNEPLPNGEVTYILDQNWGSGYTASLGIKNTTEFTLNSWQVDLTFSENHNLYCWSYAHEKNGQVYTFKSNNTNKNLAPGESFIIEVQADYTGSFIKPQSELTVGLPKPAFYR